MKIFFFCFSNRDRSAGMEKPLLDVRRMVVLSSVKELINNAATNKYVVNKQEIAGTRFNKIRLVYCY